MQRSLNSKTKSCRFDLHALSLAVCTVFLWPGMVQAQKPTISSPVYNAASYSTVVAPGSIITFTGLNLGPPQLLQASGYPLPISLGGTTVEVSINGVAISAPILYTSSRQVAAMLPSRTPTGNASLTVSHTGESSAGQRFSVVQSRFGIFTASSSGRGPAAVQNVNEPERFI